MTRISAANRGLWAIVAGASSGIGTVPAERVSEYGAAIPMGRVGTPEDIAGIAVFLVSDLARYMTGVLMSVDGGASVD